MDRHQRIEARAYAIWQREGRPEGRDEEHWHKAVQEIDAEDREAGTGSVIDKAQAALTGAAQGVMAVATGAISAGMNAAADVIESAVGPKGGRGAKAKKPGETQAQAVAAPQVPQAAPKAVPKPATKKAEVSKTPKAPEANATPGKATPEKATPDKSGPKPAASGAEDKAAKGKKRGAATMH